MGKRSLALIASAVRAAEQQAGSLLYEESGQSLDQRLRAAARSAAAAADASVRHSVAALLLEAEENDAAASARQPEDGHAALLCVIDSTVPSRDLHALLPGQPITLLPVEVPLAALAGHDSTLGQAHSTTSAVQQLRCVLQLWAAQTERR